MADSQVVYTTPYGRPANISNTGSRLFLTYRRASETAPCNKLVVTNICVVLANKVRLNIISGLKIFGNDNIFFN